MIQRKQTLFLLAAMVLLGLMYVVPAVAYHRLPDDARFTFHPWGLENHLGVVVPDFNFPLPFQWILAVCILGMGVSIFLYGNRPRQMRVVRGISLLVLLCGGAQAFVHQSVQSYLGTAPHVESSFQAGFFLPFLAFACCWLAERGIRQDEQLVRSMDRLR
ncbi:MAG: DUF4293 domain-containing protein [Flavobacteriales bacterium]